MALRLLSKRLHKILIPFVNKQIRSKVSLKSLQFQEIQKLNPDRISAMVWSFTFKRFKLRGVQFLSAWMKRSTFVIVGL